MRFQQEQNPRAWNVGQRGAYRGFWETVQRPNRKVKAYTNILLQTPTFCRHTFHASRIRVIGKGYPASPETHEGALFMWPRLLYSSVQRFHLQMWNLFPPPTCGSKSIMVVRVAITRSPLGTKSRVQSLERLLKRRDNGGQACCKCAARRPQAHACCPEAKKLPPGEVKQRALGVVVLSCFLRVKIRSRLCSTASSVLPAPTDTGAFRNDTPTTQQRV